MFVRRVFAVGLENIDDASAKVTFPYGVKANAVESTYLVWLDCHSLYDRLIAAKFIAKSSSSSLQNDIVVDDETSRFNANLSPTAPLHPPASTRSMIIDFFTQNCAVLLDDVCIEVNFFNFQFF